VVAPIGDGVNNGIVAIRQHGSDRRWAVWMVVVIVEEKNDGLLRPKVECQQFHSCSFWVSFHSGDFWMAICNLHPPPPLAHAMEIF
jgi:hypothetical protein